MNQEQVVGALVSIEKIRLSISTITQFPVIHMLAEVKLALKEIILECSKIEKLMKEAADARQSN
jgi:hypothetical protein